MAKRFLNRKQRSIILANLIIKNNLFDEWRVYSYRHPKIKSAYRLANLFMLNKKLLYRTCDNPDMSLNCDNLFERYYA